MHEESQASQWVVRFAEMVAAGADVLDVAAGSGRHTRFWLDRGHPVVAVDVDTSGLGDLVGRPGLEIVEADLERDPWPLGDRTFGAVVVANYLHRALFPNLVASVGPAGILVYETFAAGNERFGRPSNPDYLLRPGELLEVVRPELVVVAFEEATLDAPRPAVVQRICAVREEPRPAP